MLAPASDVSNPLTSDEPATPMLPAAPAEENAFAGLTARGVLLGLALGTVTTVENVYFALKYGWTTTNNITACILGFAMLSAWSRAAGAPPPTPSETCVVMTCAIAGGTAAVASGSIPFALLAMAPSIRDAVSPDCDDDGGLCETWAPTLPRLIAYGAALVFIGFALSIPLRKRFVIDRPLPFPYSLAAAKTINSLHAGGDEASYLLTWTAPAALFAMATWCWDGVERLAVFGQYAKTRYSWQLNLSVAPFGHGFLVPARYVFSEVLGAALACGGLIPLARRKEGSWYPKGAPGFEGLDAFIYMPAIAAIAATSLYQLLRTLVQLSAARKTGPREALLPAPKEQDRLRIPKRVWMSWWAATSLVALAAFPALFQTPLLMTAVALVASPLWSIGITEGVGTTGSNVASSAGKCMIILFACWAGSPEVVALLALGALSTGVIDQALDLVRDFKTAHCVGAPPRALLAAQLLGAAGSVFTSAVIYYWYVSRIALPSEALPAVIAISYRGLAVAFSGGIRALPDHCLEISAACGAIALAFDVARDLLPERLERRCPSGIAFGVGLILLSGQVLCSLCGLGVFALWRRLRPEQAARRGPILGAALLAGDGIAGVIQAGLEAGGVEPPWTFAYPRWWL